MPGKKYRSIKGGKKGKRQYNRIKRKLIREGRSTPTAKRIAAATTNRRRS